MDYHEFLNEIKNPEKEVIELKSSFKGWDEIAKTIAAFSTKSGGKIFVGVDRGGCPIGTLCNKEIRGKLQGLANNEIKPPADISVELINHDTTKNLVIGCITVRKSKGIFSYKNVSYERKGDVNHPLSPEEIFELQKNINKLYFDELPARYEERPALISDIDETKVLAYLQQVKRIHDNSDIRRFLTNNLYMVDGGQQVKNAAIMIFGKDPQKSIPQMKVRLAIFGGKNITDQFVKKEFIGDILEIFQKTFIELQRNMKIYSFIEGTQRFDVPEYPLEVLRECLINSIVHRDYYDRTEMFIKIFTDRIEFVNPAGFPFENYSFDEIKRTKISKRRNPLIANFFEDLGFMEQEGRGLERIESGLKEHGLPQPIFEASQKTVSVILKNVENKDIIKNSPYKRIVDFGSLNERQSLLINHLSSTNIRYVSRIEYIQMLLSKNIQISELTASRDLQELVSKNVLTKFGDKKGTKYSLT